MSDDIHKKDIPREFVNPTYARAKLSIWEIVQLLGHGAVQVDKLPKEIQDRVYTELDRRHEIYEAKITLNELLEKKEVYEIAVRDKHRDWKECEEYLPFLIQEIERLQEKIRRKN